MCAHLFLPVRRPLCTSGVFDDDNLRAGLQDADPVYFHVFRPMFHRRPIYLKASLPKLLLDPQTQQHQLALAGLPCYQLRQTGASAFLWEIGSKIRRFSISISWTSFLRRTPSNPTTQDLPLGPQLSSVHLTLALQVLLLVPEPCAAPISVADRTTDLPTSPSVST